MTIHWQPRAAALAEQLGAGGAQSDPRWAAAVRETPRHVFVPRFYDQRPDLTGWQEITEDTHPDRWADAVYSDRTLVTEVRSQPGVLDGFPVPVSSSTLPSAARRDAVLVVPLTGSLADGGLVRLVADGAGAAHGGFASFYAGFMPLRATGRPAPPPTRAPAGSEREQRVSVVDPALLDHDQPLGMIAQLRLPPLEPRRTAITEDGRPVTVLRAGDGSWVRAEHLPGGGASVRSGGPTDLWGIVEDAHDWWTAPSRPGWDRFGLSVTQDAQMVWLDDPTHELARHVGRVAHCSRGAVGP